MKGTYQSQYHPRPKKRWEKKEDERRTARAADSNDASVFSGKSA